MRLAYYILVGNGAVRRIHTPPPPPAFRTQFIFFPRSPFVRLIDAPKAAAAAAAQKYHFSPALPGENKPGSLPLLRPIQLCPLLLLLHGLSHKISPKTGLPSSIAPAEL